MFRPPRASEIFTCMPLPGLSAKGLGLNEPYSPLRAATVLTTFLNVMTSSAAVSGAACLKSTSFWPGPCS